MTIFEREAFQCAVPSGQKGSRKFSPTILRHQKKLQIEKTDPRELTPLLGEMGTMPGLPTGRVFYDVDLETSKV